MSKSAYVHNHRMLQAYMEYTLKQLKNISAMIQKCSYVLYVYFNLNSSQNKFISSTFFYINFYPIWFNTKHQKLYFIASIKKFLV